MRRKILRLVVVASYWLGVTNLLYWLNRKAKRIVTFHNVLPDNLAERNLSVGCSESVSDFKKKIEEISTRFPFSTDVWDYRTITITFDDGILNEYEVAGRILKERDIPAIMFVTGDVIGMTPETAFVIDKVNVWSERASESDFRAVFGVSGISKVERWQRYVQPGYRLDVEPHGRSFLEQLESVRTVRSLVAGLDPEWVRLRLSGVKNDQLDDLRSHRWLIGWHTQSHFPLGVQSIVSRRQELDAPKIYRDVVLGYPYGDIASVGVETLSVAEELGYPCAVSNDPDYSPHHGRFFMQRFSVSSDKYELNFVLSGAKYFFKHGKLLQKIEVSNG